jgi:hypothetical protein
MASATEAAPTTEWRQLLQPELQGAVTLAISWSGTDDGAEGEKGSAAGKRRKCSNTVPDAHVKVGRQGQRFSPGAKKRRTEAQESVTIAKGTIASKSEYFAKMFLQRFTERASKKVEIPVNSSEGSSKPDRTEM